MAKGKPGKTGPAVLDRSPSQLLRRALQKAMDLYAEEFGDAGLTQRQYAVLAGLASADGATQADLVRLTGIDRSTLAEMAVRMKEKGLLDQAKSATDGRANALTLTDAGRAALAEASPKMAASDARLLKLLPRGDRDRLVGLLRDLLKTELDPEKAARKAAKKAKKAKKAEAEAEAPAV